MLFVVMAEGMLWMIGLGGFGLWCWRIDMVGSEAGGVCGNLMGTLAAGVSVGAKGNMMMSVVVAASVMCD